MDHGNMAPMNMTNNATMMPRKKMMMHMTFYWGTNSLILFTGWPGESKGMYALALLMVFVFAFFIEFMLHTRFLKKESNNVVAGLIQTCMHILRVGLAYLVMLAVMSFNGGVFIAAVAGHTLGFLFFGSRIFKKTPLGGVGVTHKNSDLPPMSC
ncbi:hypothetical protein ACFE04_014402 [Oxalis oulophora]